MYAPLSDHKVRDISHFEGHKVRRAVTVRDRDRLITSKKASIEIESKGFKVAQGPLLKVGLVLVGKAIKEVVAPPFNDLCQFCLSPVGTV
jgi:hypothetical protein